MINRTVALKFWKEYGGDNDASVKNTALIASRWGWNLKEAMKLFTEFLKTNPVTADTFEGKEGVWRTVRGTPIFFPDGEDGDKIIAEKFKSPVKQSPKSKSEKKQVRFPEARKKHQEFIKGREDQSYSFDPVTGKGFDAFDETQAKEMYNEYGNGSDPVYFISKTNHQGQLTRESESEYIEAFNEGKRPLIGHWVSEETGFDYTDISFAESDISENEAKSLLKTNAQESALVLKPNGRVEFLNA